MDELVEICHGSPFDEDAYIFDELDAVRALKTSQRPLCLFGHTHWPVTFELVGRTRRTRSAPRIVGRAALTLAAGVEIPAQSRDRSASRATAIRARPTAIVDTAAMRVELFRVDYPIETTQAKMIKAGLPEVLAQRLAVGR